MTLTSKQSDAFWDRVDSILQRHAPDLYKTLNPPATDQQVADAEAQLGMALPQEVRDAYLRHNGSVSDKAGIFVDWGWWCTLEAMVRYWKSRFENIEQYHANYPDLYPDYAPYWDKLKVRPEWWNPHWIPFVRTNTISTTYIDMQPGPAGIVGQVIYDFGSADAAWRADSFNAYLLFVIDRLESGRLVYDLSTEDYIDTQTGKSANWKYLNFHP